jgi:hypothetical protein
MDGSLDMTATNYHESTDALRRELCRASLFHSRNADQFMGDGYNPDGDVAAKVAAVGSTMAANYAYVLAATLKFARDQFGDKVADALAFEVDEMVTNGDFDDHNRDILAVLEAEMGERPAAPPQEEKLPESGE